tara:strand:- start:2165 stop:2566 length:402 start_codon:yes stop_codon:yes gene_type:complete
MLSEKNIFLIILIITNILTNYLIFNVKNYIEKYVLIISSILQIISIIVLIKNYLNILNIIDKIFFFILFLGVFIFNNYYINILIIFILLTTLTTRFLFNKCLFEINKKNKKNKIEFPDILYFILLIIYIFKLI